MADVGLSDLGSASNPLSGLDASDYEGFGAGGNISGVFGDPGSLSPLSLGALGAGAAGLGAMLFGGPPSLPQQYQQVQGNATQQFGMGRNEFGQGRDLVTQGQEALLMAQRGQLTPEQQAQLRQYSTGLESTSRQQMYNLGLNPDANTGFVTQQGNIDAQVNAMAQQQIQSTIALGLGEIQQGGSLMSGGGQMMTAADQALISAGNAQIQLDKQYSDSLTAAFKAIGTMAAFALV